MRWLILGEWRAHRLRALVAVLAIAVGVALGFAVHLVNSAALDSFQRAVATVSGSADVQVRARSPAGFAEDLYPALVRTPGVAMASPVVELPATTGQLRRPGDAAPVAGGRLTLIGLDMLRAATVTPSLVGRPLHDTAGQLDADSVFLSRAVLEMSGRRVGEAISITAAGRASRFIIAGVLAGAGDEQRLAVIDIAEAQARYGQIGRLQRLDVKLAKGAERDAVLAAISKRLPLDAELVTAAREEQRADALSRAYRVNLGMLALVALLTGGFLVYSAQSLSVARRHSQFALLRVLGLKASGLIAQVVIEGLVLGVIGAVLGLGLGWALADLAITRFGGDLGGGYFSGARARVGLPPLAALGFGALGLATAVIGSLVPALAAARAQPAVALKGSGDVQDPRHRPLAWPALTLLAAGGLAALAPPIADLPILGYGAMALLLAGGVALMPALARWLMAPLARLGSPLPALDLAIRRLWGAPGQASVALCGIVASTALMVAMAVMVSSFRQSVDDWLVAVLPADLYLHLEGAEAGGIDAGAQARLAAVPGVAAVRFQRNMPLRLAADRPAVQLMAMGVGDRGLPLIAQVPVPAGATPVWVSEPMAWLYGWKPGERRRLPLGTGTVDVVVAGVWRDYSRQFGAIALPMAAYARATGDATASEAAITLAPGADPSKVQAQLQAALPAAVAGQALFGRPGDMRRIALNIFDRSFAVTYALEAIAILIGLAGVATTFSAQTLARAREFGMLRHIGVTRGQVLAMLGSEGAGLGLVGALAGAGLGLVMAQVLIHVVNPQSFHWTMDTAIPWPLLGGLVAALVVAAAGTAALAGRRALGPAAVQSVRADW